jgi:hypothetical protein
MSEMNLPEQVLVRRRLQIFRDGDAPNERAPDLLEKEDRWVPDFIERLAQAIRNIGRRK